MFVTHPFHQQHQKGEFFLRLLIFAILLSLTIVFVWFLIIFDYAMVCTGFTVVLSCGCGRSCFERSWWLCMVVHHCGSCCCAFDRIIWLGPRIVARDIWSSILFPVFITYRFTYFYIYRK